MPDRLRGIHRDFILSVAWTATGLAKLSAAELRGLARCFGAPFGRRPRRLWLRLGRFGNDPGALAPEATSPVHG
jgi:hypothetical protein